MVTMTTNRSVDRFKKKLDQNEVPDFQAMPKNNADSASKGTKSFHSREDFVFTVADYFSRSYAYHPQASHGREVLMIAG